MGEDIFCALIAVGLISTFILALSHSYSAHEERMKLREESSLILSVSDRLKNETLCRSDGEIHPGVINRTAFQEELPKFKDLLARKGFELRVEILTLDRRPLLQSGRKPGDYARSVSLPVVFQEGTRRRPARMVVWIWRG